ncbi:3-isopropylmalate dehydratase, small subunit [Acetomicrobium mobile DSM 13181]|uniref:3-isopropylmalate dehydratase small subunit n=1 Tax=Acetomicrobium mobile (strain ATCC BAA-54 / DSM 13181 / JCM 12221 / NGA) TaxID=891968 RepID=I4BXA5_ACEMN|nr:3-isopropylmalate dehydratase small subunit [Acetomicrobium mobile]AFM21912.1 3-isopropylmalate dehydratase, small subunit [Acetomicrobium mobile DSM 13181]
MNSFLLKGRAHKFGDDINTDYIIAGKYTKTLNLNDLALHLFEDIDPNFSKKMKGGDLVVAGKNFGCGSSREQAPIAIKESGIAAVLAHSFARIFFRNAINIGLPALVCNTDEIDDGDELEVDLENGLVLNITKDKKIPMEPMPDIMKHILREGGLVPYLKKYGDFVRE